MDTIDTESNMTLDPGDEVQRLQELVRTLELQNQVLRTKHSGDPDQKLKSKKENVMNDIHVNKDCLSDSSVGDNSILKDNKNVDGMKNNISDDLDILDVNTVPALEDEESWLFSSPKRTVKQQQKISPYKWMRQEFESPEVETAKRSLVYKLDEVARGSPVMTRSPIDTRTFTRPPKKSILSTRQSPSNTLRAQGDSSRSLSPSPRNDSPRNISPRNSPEYDRNGNSASGATSSSSSSLSSATAAPSVPRCPAPPAATDSTDAAPPPPARNPAADVMDIQVMARMQEESLRQSINASPKKTFKGIRSMKQPQYQQQQQHHQQQHVDHDSSESSARSSPARFEGDMYQVHHRSSNNSLAGSSLSSHSNSPPDSPYNSSQQLHRPVSEMHRRSLPNLSGRQTLSPALHSHPSDTNLRQSERQHTTAEPPPALHSYTPRRTISKPSTPTAPPAAASYAYRGGYSKLPGSGVPRSIPSPSSGQHRASPGGGIPRPRTSRLPAPRSRIPAAGRQSLQTHNNHNADDSWKDGCF